MSASAPKSQSAKQPFVSIPPMILANIREKNRVRRQRQIGIELKEWRNAQ
jgi:hypothetical protein